MKFSKTSIAVIFCAVLLCGCNTVNNITSSIGSRLGLNGQKKTEKKVNKAEKAPLVPIGDDIDGEWKVVAVGDVKIGADEDMPYMNFNSAEKRVYAYNGCNFLNGGYTLTKQNRLSFSRMISTMKYCPEQNWQYTLNRAFNDSVSLTARLDKTGCESLLVLDGDGGNILITLRRHNMGFLNGNWRILSVGNRNIEEQGADIFFDIAELKVHGNTGCNYFNGTIFMDPERSNAIDFSKIITTRMACPDGSAESAILLALEETETALVSEDGNKVMLTGSDGRQLMTLLRAETSENGE